MEAEPIMGVVKDCQVICQPKELKEYNDGVKVVVVSEKLFSNLMSSLSEMEEDLMRLKELNLNETVHNIEIVREKIEKNLKELSYSEYIDKE